MVRVEVRVPFETLKPCGLANSCRKHVFWMLAR